MSTLNFSIRFIITYSLSMVAAGVIAGLLGISKASSLNTPILFAILYWCLYSYSTKNSRLIAGKEKWKIILITLTANILISTLLAVPTLLSMQIPMKYLLVGLIVVIPTHIITVLLVNWVVKKQIVKKLPELQETT